MVPIIARQLSLGKDNKDTSLSLRKCTWDPILSGKVQQHFEIICQRRMKDMVSRVRTSRKWPNWIKDTLWKEMTTYWDTEEAKEKSSATSTPYDRKGLGPPTHLSRHQSYGQIQQEMEEELKRPVRFLLRHIQNKMGRLSILRQRASLKSILRNCPRSWKG